ncbi:MAG: hypothetical protein KDD24_08845, partial [Flavobacteriales bacterium]|nr:hypothetical protein [Flavobacteriales bacterium]
GFWNGPNKSAPGLVGGRQVKIDAAERAIAFGLADDDGNLFIQSNPVPQGGAALNIGFDGLIHERHHRFFKFIGRFIEANDESFVTGNGFVYFVLKG